MGFSHISLEHLLAEPVVHDFELGVCQGVWHFWSPVILGYVASKILRAGYAVIRGTSGVTPGQGVRALKLGTTGRPKRSGSTKTSRPNPNLVRPNPLLCRFWLQTANL